MKKESVPMLSGARIEIPDTRYKADLDLHDRYQAFSAELIRLSLAGIAVIGLILSLLHGKDNNSALVSAMRAPEFFWAICTAISLLALSVGFALLHRFMASDGMYHHLRAIKCLILFDDPTLNPHRPIDIERLRAEAFEDEETRNSKFGQSGVWLLGSGVTLFLGAIALGLSIVLVLR